MNNSNINDLSRDSANNLKTTVENTPEDSIQNLNNYKPYFKKVTRSNSIVNPTFKFFNQDLNQQYQQDPNKFICKIQHPQYIVERKFIHTNSTGIKLYYTNFHPNIFDIPQAQILVIHGLYEHSGLYINFADFFAKKGLAVHIYDQRGFGYSSGIPRNMSAEEFQQDLTVILKNIDKDIPLYIYCHSSGVNYLLSYFIMNPQVQINGIIALNSFLDVPKSFKMNFFRRFGAKIALFFYEDIIVNSKINLSALCKNSYHIKKIIKDDHIMPHLTLRMAIEIVETCQYVKKYASLIQTPMLIMHGKDDVISKFQNSEKLFNLVNSTQKQKIFIEGGMHQPHLDNNFEVIHQKILDWILDENESVKPKLNDQQLNCVQYGLQNKSNNNNYIYMLMIILGLIILCLNINCKYSKSIQRLKCLIVYYLIKNKKK